MRFEETSYRLNGKGQRGSWEVINLLSDFLKSGIEVAEIKDWEDTHASQNAVCQSLNRAVKLYYNGEIRVSKSGEHIFIARIEK